MASADAKLLAEMLDGEWGTKARKLAEVARHCGRQLDMAEVREWINQGKLRREPKAKA